MNRFDLLQTRGALLFCLLSLSLGFLGCSTPTQQREDTIVNDPFMGAMLTFFANVMQDDQPIMFAANWYYNVYSRWPTDREQIETLILEQKAPLDLSEYSILTFQEQSNGELKISYTKERNDSKRSGSVTINKDGSENSIDQTPPDLTFLKFFFSEKTRPLE